MTMVINLNISHRHKKEPKFPSDMAKIIVIMDVVKVKSTATIRPLPRSLLTRRHHNPLSVSRDCVTLIYLGQGFALCPAKDRSIPGQGFDRAVPGQGFALCPAKASRCARPRLRAMPGQGFALCPAKASSVPGQGFDRAVPGQGFALCPAKDRSIPG